MLAILVKDLRQQVRDGYLLMFGLVLPLTLTFVLTLAGVGRSTELAAGSATFFLFFLASGMSGLLAEKRNGTLARLLAAPVGRRTILVAKLVAGMVLALASMAVLILATSLLLGADWGPPLQVAVLVVALVAAACGLSSVAAAFARTAEQAMNQQSALAVVLGIAGGALFPLPDLEWLSRLTPHHWFLRGLGPDAEVLAPVAVLSGIALVTGSIALAGARRTLTL
ncbi:ABC transporter permease [Nonomuraea sp. NPDC050663]|uniref:ABC transporter permease n=1 Tax=Nonomuraea sp. NPDC050663 TaxID=3364370 RepID=UPI0037B4B560